MEIGDKVDYLSRRLTDSQGWCPRLGILGRFAQFLPVATREVIAEQEARGGYLESLDREHGGSQFSENTRTVRGRL